MIFQRFLRGMQDLGALDENWARDVLTRTGLRSAWLRKREPCDPAAWNGIVDDDALVWHTSRFEETGHRLCGTEAFFEHSPFISLSAGTVEPRHDEERNATFPAWYTALVFATDHGTVPGWVFYGYVSLLGRPAVPLLEFSEEVRDLHQHDFYNKYHPEGEIVAKLFIPPVRLERAARIEPADAENWIDHWEQHREHVCAECENDPIPELASSILLNARADAGVYWPPEEFSNVRGIR